MLLFYILFKNIYSYCITNFKVEKWQKKKSAVKSVITSERPRSILACYHLFLCGYL